MCCGQPLHSAKHSNEELLLVTNDRDRGEVQFLVPLGRAKTRYSRIPITAQKLFGGGKTPCIVEVRPPCLMVTFSLNTISLALCPDNISHSTSDMMKYADSPTSHPLDSESLTSKVMRANRSLMKVMLFTSFLIAIIFVTKISGSSEHGVISSDDLHSIGASQDERYDLVHSSQVQSVSLFERDYPFDFGRFGVDTATNFIIGATALFGQQWFAAGCPMAQQLTPLCWVGALAIVLSAAIGKALHDQSGSAASNSQDGLQKRDAYVQTIQALLETNGHEFLGYELVDSGVPRSIVNLEARSTADSQNQTAEIVNWRSGNLTRLGYFGVGEAHSRLSQAFDFGEHGTLRATLHGAGIDPDRALNKRAQSFPVNWFSYQWDNINVDLTRDIEYGDELQDWDYDPSIGTWFDSNRFWKYCISVAYNPHPGTAPPLGEQQNAFHGELYFNTYGGIDSECNFGNDGT